MGLSGSGDGMSSTTSSPARFDSRRMIAVYVVMALALGVMAVRLFSLQILENAAWEARSVDNRTRTISVQAQRGIIYDRNGFILARNIASYNIVITPAYLPDDDADIQEIYRQLADLTGIPVNQGTVQEAKLVAECVPGPGIAQMVELGDSNAPYRSVRIDCNVSEELALIVREKAVNWPGVSVEIEPVRDYPTGSLTADVIGFLGPIPAIQKDFYEAKGFVAGRDKVGYAGVEDYFQDILSGTNGSRVIEVDVAGQELRNLQPPVAPEPGYNLQLTIDSRLQKAAEAALIGEINSWNQILSAESQISSGAIVAINPKTGEILAMASYPTYENNRLARIIPEYYYKQLAEDPRHPLLNHAISDQYPPGSVFKLSTATGALNEGVVTLNTIVKTPGILTLTESFSPNDPGFERPFVDWIYNRNGVLNPAGFGQLDFLHCIAYSSNVCFYKLGGGYKDEIPEGLGILRLGEYARALGYDRLTGIELPGEVKGLIPSPTWKRINRAENWSTGDTYIASVGQGYVIATPLQVLMSAATIANDGKQMRPTIVRQVTDSNGNVVPAYLDADGNVVIGTLPNNAGPNARQISPFTPNLRWDITKDPLIKEFSCDAGYCEETGVVKTVQPSVVEAIQRGMRLAVSADPLGTLHKEIYNLLEVKTGILFAGKTGTAEYCDNVAQANNRCGYGLWPRHAWTVVYAPYNDPEIAVVAFAYNGGEGASVAGPMVRLVMDAYFCLKSLDAGNALSGCE
jgi:penicillin-binding protein 2